MYGKLDENVTPDQLKALKETSVTDVLLGDGEKVTIIELKRFGIKPLEIEVFSGPCIGFFSMTSAGQISIPLPELFGRALHEDPFYRDRVLLLLGSIPAR